MYFTNKCLRILTLIGGFFTYFIYGTVYTWSATNSYYASYLKNTGNLDIKVKDAFFFLPTIMLVQYPFLTPGLKLSEFITVRGTTLLGMSCMVSSYLLLYFFFSYSLSICSMALFGFGIGISFLPVMKNIWKYFPEKTGLVNGVILGGVGLSSAVLNPVADKIINPNKKAPDKDGIYPSEVSDNIPWFFILLLIIFGSLGLLALMLTFPFKSDGTTPVNIENDNEDDDYNNEVIVYHPNIESFSLGLWSIKSFQLALLCFCSPFFCFLLININRAFGNLNNLQQSHLQTMSFAFALVNGLSRFIWGYLYDHFNFKLLMFVILFTQLGISSSLYFLSSNIYWYFTGNMLIAICLSGIFVMLPPTYNKVFGYKNGADIYGVAGILVGITSVIGPVLMEFILVDTTSKEDYLIIFMFGSGCLIVGIVVLITFTDEKYHYGNGENITLNHTNILIPSSQRLDNECN